MTDSNYIKIFTGNFITVQRIVNELEKENINAVVKDDFKLGLKAALVSTYPKLLEIHVHKDELDKAVPVVESITADLET